MDQREEASEIIRKHVLWALGAGLLPLPLLDIAAVTAVQLDMLKQLADLYEADYSNARGKAFVSALTGSTLAALGASLIKAIPGIGSVIGVLSMPVLSGASTYAVGEVAVDIFRTGTDLPDADLDSVKAAYDELLEKGKAFATRLRGEAASSRDVFQALERLGELKEKGVISEEEFEAQKQKLLDRL